MANYKDIEQEQLIGYWAKKKYGTNAKILLEHKNWPDVKLLLTFRDEFECDWNQSEQGVWSANWSYVVFHGYTLKGKHLRKLENIATGILERRQKKQQQRQKIKALRNPYKKEDHMMTTTGSSTAHDIPWD